MSTIDMVQTDLFEERLPRLEISPTIADAHKIDLHRHLLGSLTVEDVQTLASQHHLILPSNSAEELSSLLTIQHPVNGLKEFFRPWQVLSRLLVAPEVVESISYLALKRAHAEKVVYTEFRATWGMTGREPFGVAEFLAAIHAGFNRGEEEFGVVARLDLGITRHLFARHPHGFRAELWSAILAAACRYRETLVVAFDLSGVENEYPAQLFAGELLAARRAGFPITIHCGETTPASEVLAAIEHLKPNRIGHALSAIDDDRVVKHLVDSQIAVEACPTSNWLTRAVPTFAQHPLRKLYERGVPVTINTDNPAICGTSMGQEQAIVLQYMKLPVAAVATFAANSLRFMFAPPSLRARIETTWFPGTAERAQI